MGSHGLQEERKLRPIACAEDLVKLSEGIDIAISQKELNKAFGDNQLGNGEPGAAPLIIDNVSHRNLGSISSAGFVGTARTQ